MRAFGVEPHHPFGGGQLDLVDVSLRTHRDGHNMGNVVCGCIIGGERAPCVMTATDEPTIRLTVGRFVSCQA